MNNGAKHSRGGNTGSRFKDFVLCASVLVVCMPMVYAMVVALMLQGDSPGTFDVTRYFTPVTFAFDYALHHGEVPFWNPLSFCGTPYAANPQTAIFSLPHVFRGLLMFSGTPRGTYLSLVFAMAAYNIAAGLGVFFLARSYGCSRSASFVAVFATTFSLLFVLRSLSFHFLPTLAWVPFIFLALLRMTRRQPLGDKLLYGAGAGLLTGAMLLSGFAQIYIYILILSGLFWAMTCLLDDSRGTDSLTTRVLRDMPGLVSMGMVAAIVSLPLMLPAIEFAAVSARAREAELIVPLLEDALPFFTAIKRLLWMPPGDYGLLEGYRIAVTGIYFLIACAWFTGPRRPVILFTVLILALFDCSLGKPFPLATLVDFFVPFKSAFAQRAMILACIPAGVLAAFGVDGVVSASKGRRGALFIIGLVLLLGQLATLEPLWLNVCLTALLVLMLSLVVFAGKERFRSIIPPALAVVVFVESLLCSSHAIPFYLEDQTSYSIADAFHHAPELWSDNVRGADPLPNQHLCLLEGAVNGYDPVYLTHVRDLVIPPRSEALYDRIVSPRQVTQYSNRRPALLLKRAAWLTREYVVGTLPDKAEVFPPTTTVFLEKAPGSPVPEVTRGETPDRCVSDRMIEMVLDPPKPLKTINLHDAEHPSLWRVDLPPLDGPLGHASLVVRYRAVGNGAFYVVPVRGGTVRDYVTMQALMLDTEGAEQSLEIPLPDFPFEYLKLAFEAADDASYCELGTLTLRRDPADEGALLRVLSRTFNRIEFEAGPLDAHRLLVYLDAAYPGWVATVDGEPVEILLADDAFKAVAVPPGTHRVAFEFHPRNLAVYLVGSSAGLAVVLCLLVFAAVKRRCAREKRT